MSNSESFWWYITLRAPRGQEEVLASLAEASGCLGSEDIGRGDEALLQIYYRSSSDQGVWLDRLSTLMGDWPDVSVHDMGRVENRPWHTEWMDAFPPLNVGARLVVMAPWHADREIIPAGRIPLYIYPGSAFGTGYHESTQAVLTLLERVIHPGDVVADIGCGSGILSIAALKLGASRVFARDLDPAVIEEVHHNAQKLNDIRADQLTVEVGDLLKGFEPKVDLLMANILIDPLLDMLPDVRAVLRPGGRAIFSGMLIAEGDRFKKEIPAAGLRFVDEELSGDWCGILAEVPR